MLHRLPNGTATAAENMADDLLLLENYPEPLAARFRHYSWSEPAFTFGVSQNHAAVKASVHAGCAIIRRASGGGIVSHLDDWTYALAVPFSFELCKIRAGFSYKKIHLALAAALEKQGVAATLVPSFCERGMAPPPPKKSQIPSACFVAPEIFDVVLPGGQKIAGAAQKRNRHGLLVQGSIAKSAAGSGVIWEKFEDDFVKNLGEILCGAPVPVAKKSAPEYDAILRGQTVRKFASREWNERR